LELRVTRTIDEKNIIKSWELLEFKEKYKC
jgi:hypothetical protein